MAKPTDLLSLLEGRDALNISSGQTTEIELYISAVSQALDRLCGPIVARDVTENHNGGDWSVWLWESPVRSITSVTEYDNLTARVLTAETNLAKAPTNYIADLDAGRVQRRSNNLYQRFACGAGNITVVFSAGRYADTTAVEERFKLAAAIMLATNWRSEQGSGTNTFGGFTTGEPVFGATFAIPNKVRELLQNDMRAPLVG